MWGELGEGIDVGGCGWMVEVHFCVDADEAGGEGGERHCWGEW